MAAPAGEHLYYCGIDPGNTGAIVAMNAQASVVKAWDIPRNEEGEYDLAGLRPIFKYLRRLPDCLVGIEWPQAWPGAFSNVIRDAENFGRGKGILESFAFLHDLQYKRVSPVQWKGRLNLPGKEADPKSTNALHLWDVFYPDHRALVRGPRGGLISGRLDAGLIAHFLRSGTGTALRAVAARYGKDSPQLMAAVFSRRSKKHRKSGPRFDSTQE
jgi:hypothetical protein